jgi:hypothetical protein
MRNLPKFQTMTSANKAITIVTSNMVPVRTLLEVLRVNVNLDSLGMARSVMVRAMEE